MGRGSEEGKEEGSEEGKEEVEVGLHDLRVHWYDLECWLQATMPTTNHKRCVVCGNRAFSFSLSGSSTSQRSEPVPPARGSELVSPHVVHNLHGS